MALVFTKEFNQYLKSQDEEAFDATEYISSFVFDDVDLLEPERVVSRRKEQMLYDMLNNSKSAQKKFVWLMKDSLSPESDESQPCNFAELFNCIKKEYEADVEVDKSSLAEFDDFDDEFDLKVPIYVDIHQCEFILDAISTFENSTRSSKSFKTGVKTHASELDLTSLRQGVENALFELNATHVIKNRPFKSR